MKIFKRALLYFFCLALILLFFQRELFLNPDKALWEMASISNEKSYPSLRVSYLLWVGADPLYVLPKTNTSNIQNAINSQNLELVNKLSEHISVEDRMRVYEQNQSRIWSKDYMGNLKQALDIE